MREKHDLTNVRPYRKKWQFNVGLIIFGIIFIYLMIMVLRYFTSTHITAYEVREGTILKDNAFTGIAIREETVIAAEGSGYVNYYVAEGNKTGVGDNIYTISENEFLSEEVPTEATGVDLTSSTYNMLLLKIQKFNESFNNQNFDATYTLKSDIENIMQNATNQTKMDQLNAKLANNDVAGVNIYTSPIDGIVTYSLDGKEELTADGVTIADFDKTNYKKTEFRNNEKVVAGTPVYKIVNSENWSVVINLPKEYAKELLDVKNIKVRFAKDNQTVWAAFSIMQQGKDVLGRLSFDNSMIRYSAERYLDIELIRKDETGLKIPKSAETKKAFYTVPEEYITTGGNSNEPGVFRIHKEKKGKDSTEFLAVEIYNKKDGMDYLDPNIFEEGDILVKPESTDTFILKDKKNLKGVYNINKGYAVFKQISILCESDEYYIVEEGNNYGLSNYDHIALIGKHIKENEVIFR